jgi:hypothetical protein
MSRRERRKYKQQQKQQKKETLPVTPDIPTEVVLPKNASDLVAALSALYQGEKTDASSVFNTAMAMMGVAVTYLVAAIPFVDSLSQKQNAELFLVLLPFPLWMVIAFHSLMTLNAMSHGISVRIIEDALFAASGLPCATREMVGSASGDKVMDITQSKFAHKITTVVVYVGVAFLVGGFTVFALYSASKVNLDKVVWVHFSVIKIGIATYGLLLIMVAWSWIAGICMINKGRNEIPKHEK